MRLVYSLVILLALATAGCGDSPTEPGNTGILKVSLTDAPSAFGEVNLTFTEVSAHIDEAWVPVASEPTTVNLLEWNNGNSMILGTAEVPAGHYTQIRLLLGTEPDDGVNILGEPHPFPHYVIDDYGDTKEMKVPSGYKSGIKLIHGFDIETDATTELVLDFDASKSVVIISPVLELTVNNSPSAHKFPLL